MSPMRGMHSAEAHNALISKGLDPRRNFLQANTNIKKVEKHRFLGNTPDTTVQVRYLWRWPRPQHVSLIKA